MMVQGGVLVHLFVDDLGKDIASEGGPGTEKRPQSLPPPPKAPQSDIGACLSDVAVLRHLLPRWSDHIIKVH